VNRCAGFCATLVRGNGSSTQFLTSSMFNMLRLVGRCGKHGHVPPMPNPGGRCSPVSKIFCGQVGFFDAISLVLRQVESRMLTRSAGRGRRRSTDTRAHALAFRMQSSPRLTLRGASRERRQCLRADCWQCATDRDTRRVTSGVRGRRSFCIRA
jgi:hypothetical protein